jgi:hypothetical protein
MRGRAGLERKVGDRVELRVVDAPLAIALFEGIPAARLLARVRLAAAAQGAPWEERLAALVGAGTADYERVRRAMARHARVALDEGPMPASDRSLAVLVWAVTNDSVEPGRDASLAEIAALAEETRSISDDSVLRACAAHDERLAAPEASKRAPAFETCVRLATRALLGPVPWERLRILAAQLERAEMGVRIWDSSGSIFPDWLDDALGPSDRRMITMNRAPLDALVAKDPKQLGPATWRTEQAAGGASAHLATFLADLTRLLSREGVLVAASSPPEPQDDSAEAATGPHPSWSPAEWSPSTAEALANALERGATTVARVQAATTRGGEAALDAIGAEMLRVGSHAFASAAFAQILARSARPRDVVRLVTYFAVAPDPAPAAQALGSCAASELPRMLGAWLEAMLPQEQEEDGAPDASTARVSACIESLKPYPALYSAVQGLFPRLGVA